MYKIIKTEKFILKIREFISSYLNSNLNLFLDTGIENENLIIESYLKSSKIFKETILFEVEKIFSEEVLMKKISEKGFFTTSFSVGGFRFFVDYTEDNEEKIRFLENVEIYKK